MAVAAWEVVGTATLTVDDGVISSSRSSGTFLLPAIITPHTITNRRNPNDHASVCVRKLKFGSTNTG